MEKGCFGNVVDMGLEGEGGVQDDTEVAGGGLEGVIVEPSILRERFMVERVRALGPIMIISDSLLLSLRKFFCIHVLISVRQVVRWS